MIRGTTYYQRVTHCVVCAHRLIDCQRGIPVFDGAVLPSDWPGEWGGADACDPCADAQALLVAPVALYLLREVTP